jgi:hypothetical protein
MYSVRKWSVSHAKSFDTVYKVLEKVLVTLDPVLKKIGHERLEKPITFVEKNIKGFLFDCQMCGQCVLHETGMSCPMNCPKELRNGPCGGVRPNGHCEVKPEMRCVWVEAWRGSKILNDDTASDSMIELQPTLDNRLSGHSSWLREVRLKNDLRSIKIHSDVC